MKRPFARGAAMPETALMLTVLLGVLVGAFRIALLGYEQVSADGAAFYHAHQSALKQTDPSVATSLDPDAATHTAFPRSALATITPQTVDAPNDQLQQTAYGFSQDTNRHGGVSMILPMRAISTVVRSGLDALTPLSGGSALSVTGVGVEPAFAESGVHADVSGYDFGTAAAFGGRVDYFTQGENTPPYFAGFHYLRYCPVSDSTDLTKHWNWCPTTTSYLALGLAEYLDQDNWVRSPNGVAPLSQAVFWETLFHQQVYANLTSSATDALPPDISTAANLAQAQRLLNHDTSVVYKWDSDQQGGFPQVGYQPGAYPLTPGAGYP